jgi:hypothetical protein
MAAAAEPGRGRAPAKVTWAPSSVPGPRDAGGRPRRFPGDAGWRQAAAAFPETRAAVADGRAWRWRPRRRSGGRVAGEASGGWKGDGRSGLRHRSAFGAGVVLRTESLWQRSDGLGRGIVRLANWRRGLRRDHFLLYTKGNGRYTHMLPFVCVMVRSDYELGSNH